MSGSGQQRNVKLVVAYDGAAYHGWQRQADGIDTIQQRLEEAAARVLRQPVVIHGAGRTDAGVHAAGQVASLRTTNLAIPLRGLRRAINSRLPGDIVVLSAAEVAEDFHASRSAVGKTYRYRIYTAPTRPVALHRRVYHHGRPLDAERMRLAGRRLVGEHDFRGFASSADQRDSTVRTIWSCCVAESGPVIHVTVEGNGFLYNMVRNIVGTLIEIGRGRWEPGRIDMILASRDRADAGPTAPAEGLSLLCVHYRDDNLCLTRIHESI
ncbi:MAG TPA: tRNA pseudouridine(38-40) synthase TruA [Phycisphaerae bacterium]|nr:tRNA pseudouridine(38-40) synthase TruA [Phycisphaerae bacterium]